MAIITGSSTTDWSTISLSQVDFEAHFVTFLNRVGQILTAIQDPANYSIVSASRTVVVLDLVSGGRLRLGISGFTPPLTSSFSFSNTATGELLQYGSRVLGNGDEFVTSATIGSTGFSETVKGNIFIPSDFPPNGNVSGSVTSLVVKIGSATVTFSGSLNMMGDLISASLTGTVTAVLVASGANTIKMTGLSVDIDVLEAAIASGDLATVGDLFSVVGNLMPGDDTITYANNSGVGMSFSGGAGNDTITISGPNGDTLNGGDGNDILAGGLGQDTVNGEAGDDRITMLVTAGNTDTIDAGADNDTLVLSGIVPGTHEVVVDLSSGTDQVVSSGGVADALAQTNFEHLNAAGIGSFVTVTGSDGDNIIVGSTGNDVIDGGLGNDTMTGGLGHDSYTVDSVNDVVTEAASAGTDRIFSSVDYTLGVNVEHLELTGAGDIDGTGNALANILTGNSGINVLTGGLGNDTYVVQNDTDSVVEAPNAGTDLVQSTAANFTLGANVEHLTLMGGGNINGTGNALANTLTGNSGDNQLTGGLGNDRLLGNAGHDRLDGGVGVDTMIGGLGDDTYVRDAATDVITEALNAGTDTVESSLTYTLGANVENLILTGTGNINGTGTALNNELTGNSGNNILSGLAGNDTLNGENGNDTLIGGLGADTMVGGLGDDLFIVDSAADTVTEAVGEGSDTVRLAYNVAVATEIDLNSAYGEVENVQVLGTGLFNLTGNAADNILTGNGSINTLIGNDGNDTLNGGLGADNMTGGLGDDTYVIDNLLDVINEAAGDANDTVQINRSVDLNVAPFDEIEHVVLTGVAALNATGDGGNNQLTGNSGANILNGGDGNDTLIGGLGNDTLNGGTGDDAMDGGAGNDTYVVESALDTVTESVAGAAGGVDVVQSAMTFSLASLGNVEHLTLTGSGDESGTGNSLNNILTGNSGNNQLTGGAGNDTLVGGLGNDVLDGGTGADRMAGGFGNDTYVRDAATDVITEGLNAGTDTVRSALNYTLGANVENLELIGTAVIGTGNALANSLTGNDGNNTLTGLAGNDELNGGDGNDILNGGVGSDNIQGGAGNDLILLGSTLEFAVGETIDGGADTDTLRYTGAAAGTLTLTNLVSNIEQVQIANAAGLTTGVAAINVNAAAVTSNGMTLTGNNGANVLTGTGLDDSLIGNAGNDILNGGGGNDMLNGGLGNDTFGFALGDGQDLVQDNSGTADRVLFQSGINPLDLIISHQANGLRIAIEGTTDQITVQDWDTSAANRTEMIQAGNGQVLLSTQVETLIQAMAAFTTNTGVTWDQAAAGLGDQTQYQAIIAANWQSLGA